MRWKITVVNAIVVLLVGAVIYVLLTTSLTGVLENRAERNQDVVQALRAANAQLELDALRLERWLDGRASSEDVRAVFSAGTSEARREGATAQANRIRDAAVAHPGFARMAPSLVLFVDRRGIALGRNGSALMRGDNIAAAYPSLERTLQTGGTASSVWLNPQRQERLFTSYATVRDAEGAVAGAIIVGTPLNDERLARTSELSSGRTLLLAVSGPDRLEVLARGAVPSAAVDHAVAEPVVRDMVLGATRSGLPGACDQTLAGHLFGAAALEGYDATPAVLIAAVPTSRIGDMSGLLLGPIFGVTLLGLLLVTVGGVLLGNYISRPVSEIEDGLLAVINGNSSLRFQIEHAELGGLVFRINSLLNELTGVPEDTSDDEGRPSSAPSAGPYAEALAVGERALPPELSEPGEASVLAAEPAEVYYERLYGEYLRAKRELGEPVDHITYEAFRARIEQNERSMAEKHGRPVRFRVELRDGAVALAAVPLPG